MMIKQLSLLLALITAPAISAIELTPDTWDAETSGKTVFVKFYAPWVSLKLRILDGDINIFNISNILDHIMW